MSADQQSPSTRVLVLLREGPLAEALAMAQQAVDTSPAEADAYYGLGLALKAAARLDEAATALGQAIALDPGMGMAHFTLGTIRHTQRDLRQAFEGYAQSAALMPDHADSHCNLALILEAIGRTADALSCFQRAIALVPGHALALAGAGRCLQVLGEPQEAKTMLRRSLALRPDDAKAHQFLGVALVACAEIPAALPHLRRAVEIDPQLFDGWLNLGIALHGSREHQSAVTAFQRAIDLKPDSYWGHTLLGNVLADMEQVDEAAAAWDKALTIVPTPGTRVKRAILLPSILAGTDVIDPLRRGFIERVQVLRQQDIRLVDPTQELTGTTFYLAYHGRNDTDLQREMAAFYLEACPELAWVAPHCHKPVHPFAQGRPLRVGFISNYFQDHTISKFNRGLLANLDRRAFHVTLFHLGQTTATTEWMQSVADESVWLHGGLPSLREQVAAAELDVLFYTDIGMDHKTYFLAFSRLAPVQVVTWGHPVTTGIPTVDYFLSDADLEPAGAEAHYTERLVNLGALPCYYFEPPPLAVGASRSRFGFEADWHLYVCPQSLFKVHPDFDRILADILARDPDGRVVFIEASVPGQTDALKARMQRQLGSLFERVVFLPRLDFGAFLQLLSLADVLLDTIHFGGGNSTYEALALGTPIVTWPGEFMRGRVTAACYRKMGMADLIAADASDYVAKAVRVANDSAWRSSLVERILANKGNLFEDIQAVRQLERFLLDAVDAASNGELLQGWNLQKAPGGV